MFEFIGNLTFNFNRNRYIALFFMILGGILGWYSTILMTNESTNDLPKPDTNQIFAICLGIIMSLLYWLKKCYSIQIR